MSWPDWLVLCGTLLCIVVYGIWKSRGQKNIEGYLLGDQSLPWYHVMFSVMATQASAITFLSAPGQAYTDGMRFVQYYFGLPLAMIVISVVFLPIFHRLKVYTAYQFLEQRFDLKTRTLTAFLFLIQRGIAAGITIYAPALILSSLLGWNIYITNFFMGALVIVYTVAGGSKAVSYTQLQQMAIIIVGMFVAGYMVVQMLPEGVGFSDALHVAGKMGKLNVVDPRFDPDDKYTLWSGLIGGFFLALSYFGTDQSQVGRYLSGKSVAQSRVGMLMNGMVKIPMQFLILLIGALLFAFYQFHTPPVFFNKAVTEQIRTSPYAEAFEGIEAEHAQVHAQKNDRVFQLVDALHAENEVETRRLTSELNVLEKQTEVLRDSAKVLIGPGKLGADNNDTNYIFLHFVITFLPAGLIGLLIAVIFSASWSSTSSELNALASTSIVDFYKRHRRKPSTAKHELLASKWATVLWGCIAIGVAMFANRMGSLIEAINVLGSLFYGTILGIFLVAFWMKKIGGTAVFIAALITEAIIFTLYATDAVAFLWLNPIGCGLVMFFAFLFQRFLKLPPQAGEQAQVID